MKQKFKQEEEQDTEIGIEYPKEVEEIWEEDDRDQEEIMEAWDEILAEREQEEKLKNAQDKIIE
jgi:hypothetical protein